MTTINLLPWRQIKRKLSKQYFLSGLAGALVITWCAILLVNYRLNSRVNNSSHKVSLLETKLANYKTQLSNGKNNR